MAETEKEKTLHEQLNVRNKPGRGSWCCLTVKILFISGEYEAGKPLDPR